MKILHVIRPAEGGMKGHLLSLAAGLAGKGCTVEVACPRDSSLAAELKERAYIVHPIDLVGPLNPLKDLACIWQLKRIIDNGNYNLVHFHGSKAGLVGRLAAVLAGFSNTVLTVHNFIIYDEVPPVKKFLFKSGEKVLSRVTSEIITVSRALKDDLAVNYNINPAGITPVYNGIDTSRYEQLPSPAQAKAAFGFGPDTLVVGTVARMAPQKGLKYLLEAIPAVNESMVQGAGGVAYVVAGDGPLRQELEELAGKLGVLDKVLFPGFIMNIRQFFASLDIFVIPSISEGLSITTMEAMASGLPVVATRVGGLPELVTGGETGIIVAPRDPQAIAEAIGSLLKDQKKRLAMGAKAKELARKKFSAQNMIDNTLAVYEKILNNKSGVHRSF